MNDLVGTFLSYFGVMYGLLLGMLAVAAYQNKSDIDRIVVREASSLACLYRDVSVYPEPLRSQLQERLRGYSKAVIEDDWPKQRLGIVPEDSTKKVDLFQRSMMTFAPKTPAEEIIHAEAFSQFNTLVECRRLRLFSINTGIPSVMWYTLIVGAVIATVIIWMFDCPVRTLFFLGGVVTFFNGTMISLIIVMDNPFRGDTATSASAFAIVSDSLMDQSDFNPTQGN